MDFKIVDVTKATDNWGVKKKYEYDITASVIDGDLRVPYVIAQHIKEKKLKDNAHLKKLFLGDYNNRLIKAIREEEKKAHEKSIKDGLIGTVIDP